MPEYKFQLEKEINFLVFWGKLDRAQAIRMPRWKRKYWVDLTIENLKQLFGESTGSKSETRELKAEDFKR